MFLGRLARYGRGYWMPRWQCVRALSRLNPGPTASLDNNLPIVALVGRPNVGKSALFNRLIHRRVALVKNTPESHVTRDYRCGIAKLGDLLFTLVDTSGLGPTAETQSIQARATQITKKLMERVDLTLFMIDGREQLTVADEDVARWLLKLLKDRSKLLLVANKCEALATDSANSMEEIRDHLNEAYRLGMGEAVAISAQTGDGMINLCEALIPFLPEPPTTADKASQDSAEASELSEEDAQATPPLGVTDRPIAVAIMGLPNVGKSTLMNYLLRYERSLCGPESGLTRDPVSETLTLLGRQFKLVDTAGWVKFFAYEKPKEVSATLAKEAYYAAQKVLNLSHVVVVMMDISRAEEHGAAIFRQEMQLASTVLDEKRVLILVLNKMDMLEEDEREHVQKEMIKKITGRFYDVDNLVCLPISAKTGYGVDQLIPQIIEKVDKWNTKVRTSVLNDWFSEMASVQRLAAFSSPAMRRIKFLSQTKIRPPTFCLRVAGRTLFTDVEKRTFVNAIRQSFDFQGVPIRVVVKYNTTWDSAKQLMATKQRKKGQQYSSAKA